MRSRLRWLGSPAFLAAVGVLALNDQVLKARFPGWWTGKLSDVAGVAVVATAAAVVFGVRRGVVATAAAFTALKVVPGVAEAAAPLLGGTTLRDATDLLALVVLVPLDRGLRRAETAGTGPAARPSGRRSVAWPVLGVFVAVLTSSATSCRPQQAVTFVTADDDRLLASLGGNWAESVDGGRTWSEIDDPEGIVEPDRPGPDEACVEDTCWRLVDGDVIELDGVEELRLSTSSIEPASTGCGGDQGLLTSIAAVDTDDGPAVVTTFGAGGVLVRSPDGTWERVGVLGVDG